MASSIVAAALTSPYANFRVKCFLQRAMAPTSSPVRNGWRVYIVVRVPM